MTQDIPADLAALCIAAGTDDAAVERIVAAQTDPLRAMLLAVGAATSMDSELGRRFYGQLAAMEGRRLAGGEAAPGDVSSERRAAEAMREAAAKVALARCGKRDCEMLSYDPSTGAYDCSLDCRGKDCLCNERDEEGESIAQAIRALPLPEPTLDPRDAEIEKLRSALIQSRQYQLQLQSRQYQLQLQSRQYQLQLQSRQYQLQLDIPNKWGRDVLEMIREALGEAEEEQQ